MSKWEPDPQRFMIRPSDEARAILRRAVNENPDTFWRDIATGFFEAGALAWAATNPLTTADLYFIRGRLVDEAPEM